MKKGKLILCMLGLYFGLSVSVAAQQDSGATLEWVERQAGRIDLFLADAIQAQVHTTLLINMLEAHRWFDAVSLAGVYCVEVRKAALEGRRLTDVVNQYLGEDYIAGVQHATNARNAAEKMRLAARACASDLRPPMAIAFTPTDVIREEVAMAKLLLEDGLAAEDMHILSQKIQYVIRLLTDVQTLAASLDTCDKTEKRAKWALERAEAILYASDWPEVAGLTQEMLVSLQALSENPCE